MYYCLEQSKKIEKFLLLIIEVMSTVLQKIYNDIIFGHKEKQDKKDTQENEPIEMVNLGFSSLSKKVKKLKINEYLIDNKSDLEQMGFIIDDNVFVNYKFINVRYYNHKVQHLVLKQKTN